MIEGANTSRQDFTSHVETGSNRQKALEDSRTTLHTSPLDSEEKFSRFSFVVTGASRGSWTWNLSRFSFMISIFLRKKVPNSFASLVGSSCSGRAVSSGSLDKELTTRNSLRESPAHWSIRFEYKEVQSTDYELYGNYSSHQGGQFSRLSFQGDDVYAWVV